MASKKIRTKYISLEQRQGTFSTIFSRIMGEGKKEISDIALLRSLLSNERARLLHTLKQKQPNSIYELAKILDRDFKSVRQDIAMLEELGFIEMIPIHKGNREKLKPLLVADILEIKVTL